MPNNQKKQAKIDAVKKINDSLDSINAKTKQLYVKHVNCDNCTLEEIEEHLEQYNELFNEISDCLHAEYEDIGKITDIKESKKLLKRWEDANSVLYNIHQDLYPELNNIRLSKMSLQIKKTNIKLENSLGTQFGIFSALLSVLAFILNNTKLFAIEGVTFSHIIVINLSYLLACSVMFFFVLWFIKPYKHTKGRVWTLIIIIISLSLLIGFCYVKLPNIPITIPQNLQ